MQVARGDMEGGRADLALAEIAAAKRTDSRTMLRVTLARAASAKDRAALGRVRRKAHSACLLTLG